jgi:hypothetical protein
MERFHSPLVGGCESERDPSRDGDRYNILLRLFAEEEAKHHAQIRMKA